MSPKHHDQFHLLEDWQSIGHHVDCWALERKHAVFKEVCVNHRTLANFEECMLAQLLAKERTLANQLKSKVHFLSGATVDPDVAHDLGLASATVGKCISVPGVGVLAAGMFFFRRGSDLLFEVLLFIDSGVDFLRVASALEQAT